MRSWRILKSPILVSEYLTIFSSQSAVLAAISVTLPATTLRSHYYWAKLLQSNGVRTMYAVTPRHSPPRLLSTSQSNHAWSPALLGACSCSEVSILGRNSCAVVLRSALVLVTLYWSYGRRILSHANLRKKFMKRPYHSLFSRFCYNGIVYLSSRGGEGMYVGFQSS